MSQGRNALTPDALAMMDAIARNGSFAAAARELGRVPSALTYSVRQLEESLDVLLFDRSSRQAQLTAAGAELLHEGRRLLSEMDAVASRVRRVASGWETALTIGVDDVLSTAVVLDLVQRFCAVDVNVDGARALGDGDDAGGGAAPTAVGRAAASPGPPPPVPARPGPTRQHPATRLRLRSETLAGTWEALTSGQADLAIGVAADHVRPPGFEVEPLGTLAFVFCVAPHHPLASGTAPVTDAQLVHHRAVAVADTAQRLSPISLNLLAGQDVLTVATMRAKREALVRGLGCGWLPEPLARAHLADGRLATRATARGAVAERLGYAWRSSASTLALGRALQWWLQQLRGEHTRRALLERHAGLAD